MSKIIGDTQCPDCAKRGRDSTGNHLMLFDDGGAYCNRCGYHESEGVFTEAKVKISKEYTDDELEDLLKQINEDSTIQALQGRQIKAHVCKHYGVRVSLSETDGYTQTCRYYPIHNVTGQLQGYKSKLNGETKRMFTKGRNKLGAFFGASVVPKKGNKLFITEGEDDCLALYQALYENGDDKWKNSIAVVSLLNGSKSTDTEMKFNEELIRGYKQVVLCFDMDSSGEDAVERAVRVLPKGTFSVGAGESRKDVPRVAVARYDEKDANDMIIKGRGRDLYFAVISADAPKPEKIISGCQVTLEELMIPLKRGIQGPYPRLNDKMHGFRYGDGGGELTVWCAGSGMGKCLAKGTKVLLYSGECIEVQDVRVGDDLMSPTGKPNTVTSLGKGSSQMYRVDQVKGMSYTVNEDHILSLRAGTSRPSSTWKKGDVVNLPIKDYLGLLPYERSMLKGYKADLVSLGEGCRVHEPYMLGLWLADGTSAKPSVTFNKKDTELLDEFDNFCERNEYNITVYPSDDRRGCITKNAIGGFTSYLREENLFGNKHIPNKYRVASYEDRLALIAGLLDGDGHLIGNGYEIVFVSEKLCEDFLFIARSVGLSATVRDKFSKCQGFDGRLYKRVFVFGDTDKIPVKLERKKAEPRLQVKHPTATGIQVSCVGEGEYFGFTLTGDKLYCLEDFTVTHNTTAAREVMYDFNANHGLTLGNIFLEEQYRKTCQSYIAIDNNIPVAALREDPTVLTREQMQNSYKKLINNGRLHLLKHFGSLASDGLMDYMWYLSTVEECDFIMLDHISMVVSGERSGSGGERKDLDILMTKLAAFCEDSGTSVQAIVHLRRPPDGSFNDGKKISLNHLRGSAAIEQLSHNIFAIEGSQHGDDPNGRVIRVLKNREWGDLGEADYLQYNPQTGRLLPAEVNLGERY